MGSTIRKPYHVNHRLLLTKIKTPLVNMIVIQIYFPTSNSEDDEIEQKYDFIEELLGIIEDSDNVIIMGDFNAVVVERKDKQTVDKHGLETRNNRGEKLVSFCKQNNLLVPNTMFGVPKRRRYTWAVSGNTKRYQIDYILTKSRFKKQITTNYSLPGAEIDSDYNLVMVKYRIIRKRITRRPKRKIWDVKKLKNEDSRLDFAKQSS